MILRNRFASVCICLLAISSPSMAVHLNNDGTGQVLIYPYYTVQKGNQTLISVLNTRTTGKAVKLRVLEGRNAREVLSVNLYLSAEDVWTGAIFDTDELGPGALISTDRSCTVPQLAQSGERLNGLPYSSFSNFYYATFSADSGPNVLERTREGHVEVIEMAAIAPGSELDRLISHDAGIPSGCDELSRQWAAFAQGAEAPFATSIDPASGGLMGAAAIVDSSNGLYLNVDPQVLDGFYRTSAHTRPDSLLPSLKSAEPKSVVLLDGEAVSSTWARGEDAISSVFMSEQLRNEFSTETALNAQSEWVITFPTKRFYTDAYAAGLNVPYPPFSQAFSNGGACEVFEYEVFDREEGKPRAGAGFPIMPPPPPPPSFCFGVNVLVFRQSIQVATDLSSSPSQILGSRLSRNAIPSLTIRSGWMSIKFGQQTSEAGSTARQMRRSSEGHVYMGLPTIGLAAVSIENTFAAPGVRAFYAGANGHKRKIRCVQIDDSAVHSNDCTD